MQKDCIKCKGKNPLKYCGKTRCPIHAKTEAMIKTIPKLKQNWQGSTPNIFISRGGYPNLNVGILSPPEINNTEIYDAPMQWSQQNYQISQIINLRSALVNSRFISNIKGTGKLVEIAQEIGMASCPVELEITLKNKPQFSFNTSPFTAPMGPNAFLENIQITSNPKINRAVDRIVSDTDFKAQNATTELYQRGYDENFLTKLFSTGNLGIKYQRKFVPTRWSITAVDDILAKNLIDEIKYNEHAEHCAFYGNYLGNYYLVLIFPGPWSYELFEIYKPEASWNTSKDFIYTTDYEPYSGRKAYAENCAGGYYAARLAILEKLKELKFQGSVIALRMITPDYYCPLGVFVVREATRKSLQNKPIYFENKELMINYARLIIKKKWGYDINKVLNGSIILKQFKEQSKLSQFFNLNQAPL